MSEMFFGFEIFRDARFLRDLAVALLAGGVGTAFLLRSRALERRIFSIEESLGTLASLGAGSDGDPLGDEKVLKHLEGWTRDLMGELKIFPDPAPKSAEEP